MTHPAYAPLEGVYQFHEVAEWWVLRRYAPGSTVTDAGEVVRPAFVEAPLQLFRDPRSETAGQVDGGQRQDAWCEVYQRVALRTVDDDAPAQQTDVLFDAQGRAWQAVGVDGWTDARGYVTRLRRSGTRATAPWA